MLLTEHSHSSGQSAEVLSHFSFTAQFMVPLFVGNGVDVPQLWLGICRVIKQQETNYQGHPQISLIFCLERELPFLKKMKCHNTCGMEIGILGRSALTEAVVKWCFD